MSDIETGNDTDAYCGKCKMVLAHVVIALKGSRPAKVECKTCGAIHAYKKDAPAKGTTRRTTRSSAAAKVEAYEKLLGGRDAATAIRYKLSQGFELDDVVDHKTFGLGVVVKSLSDKKIEVCFPTGNKILAHDRS